MLPDLLHFWLSGRQVSEATNASTTQFMKPITREWSTEVLDAFGIRTKILPKIVAPGTILGELTEGVSEATGLVGTVVVAPGTHETASAVAAGRMRRSEMRDLVRSSEPTTSFLPSRHDWSSARRSYENMLAKYA